MKKKYLTPEVEETIMTLEKNYLASGENLSSRNFGDDPSEDANCFWE